MEGLYITKVDGKEHRKLADTFRKIEVARTPEGEELIILFPLSGGSPVAYGIDGQHEFLIR